MIADLKPYPAMKDSGVPWVGDVPTHWKIVPNRALLKLRKEVVGSRSSEYVLLSLTKRGVIARDMENPEGKFPASFDSYQVIEPGDLVFCLFDIDETPRSVGLSSLHGMITGAYTRFVCSDEVARQFIHLFYLAMDDGKHLKPLYTGLRKVITKSAFLSARLPLPPPAEQATIVRFLDYMNRRIRRYIRAKQKLIKLLEEQKQAIIHHAVMRGLDPSVRFTSTGVDWLGDVPEHWPICRAKLLLQQVVPPIPDEAEMVTCFRDGQVTLRRNRRTAGFTNAIKELGYQGIKPGQLVLHSMDAFAGAIGMSDSAGKCSPEYVICEPAIDNVLLSYYAHLLRSLALRGLFVVLCPSVRERAPRVRFSHFGAFVLPNPPLVEQRRIVDWIHSTCREIDLALKTAKQERQLLREYQQRLVADAVTGKLDVGEAAKRVPVEITESESVGDEDESVEGEENGDDSEERSVDADEAEA